MGKRYYCDYCERSFADGAENRKKHLVSVHHQKLRKAHYDMFKEASKILEENKFKKPCRKFHSTGHCEFGTGCKYSHLTPLDVQNLEKQVSMEKSGTVIKKSLPDPDIDAWLKSKKLKSDQISDDMPSTHKLIPAVPSILSTIPNLPPSLIPSLPIESLTSVKNATLQWE